MRLRTLAIFSTTAVASVALTPPAAAESVTTLDLMPVPESVELGSGDYTVAADFSVAIEGAGTTDRLRGGVRRMLRRLSDHTTLFFEPTTFLDLSSRDGVSMRVGVEREGVLELGEDESYTLAVSGDGVRLEAVTDIGALRGLETFLQLVVLDQRGITAPVVEISDAPRFPWRGLMIDSSRHFMPVDVVKRNLDGMASVKLNVMHWHLADDQGFRVESLALPKLHEMGSDGSYYTRNQIREVIDYAAERGIRVMPEFDLPGHATSWVVGYPELASQPGPYEIERSWGIFKPTVDPTREETYRFLDTLIGEMAELFDDAFLHIGGDENTGEHWNENAEIRKFMAENGYADAHELQQYFSQRMQKILEGHGKRMVGWDEILQPELPASIVIQSWRGREALYEAAGRGYSGILSNGYYIDLIQPTDFHYLNDPLPEDAPISAEDAQRVLGGEATMWAEFVNPETVDSRIWPRTAAIAERFWSPGHIRDVGDMYRRLDRISLRLEGLGLQHERNQRMMLRRLCQCRDVDALEVLLGTVEPVKIYNRGRQRKHTSFSPLTRAVDAARPDAAPARRFRSSVERLSAGGFEDSQEIDAARSWLRLWEDNHGALEEVFRTSPALAEVESLSRDVSEISEAALDALDFLGERKTASLDWLRPRLERLEAARESRGQLELMIVEPLSKLLCAAAGEAGADEPGCRAETAPAAGPSH
ncbi:MAG: family 20 glycosylhydrolase [Acidobacteriota bacterium]|nr:family 20 glycosylhydrolase [Acidobacteriota bacterium]